MKHFANSSMRLKREGDWVEYTLPDGNVFYYNDKSNEFQWQRPDQLSSPLSKGDEDGLDDDGPATAGVEAGDWGAFKDPSTDLVFWYNHVTGESQWEPPDEMGASVDARDEKDAVTEGHTLLPHDEFVREVNSVDDLFTPR